MRSIKGGWAAPKWNSRNEIIIKMAVRLLLKGSTKLTHTEQFITSYCVGGLHHPFCSFPDSVKMENSASVTSSARKRVRFSFVVSFDTAEELTLSRAGWNTFVPC